MNGFSKTFWFGVFVAAWLAAVAHADDTNHLVPFPSPLTAASGGGSGGGGNISGTCATVNAIAYFSAASTLTCNAGLTTDGAGGLTAVNLASTGTTTFGNASGDTVTSNAAAWTFPNDTTVVLTGGVDGLNFDTNTLSIDALNNRVGYGTAAPAATVQINGNSTDSDFSIVAGTLGSAKRAFVETATIPSVAGTQIANFITVTTTAGSTGTQVLMLLDEEPGFVGANGKSEVLEIDNNVAGTGTWNPLGGADVQATDNGNFGIWSLTTASTVGTNLGSRATAYLGAISIGSVSEMCYGGLTGSGCYRQDSLDIGAFNSALPTKHASSTTERHIGTMGVAHGGDTNVGGYFGFLAGCDAPGTTCTAPTFTSAALMADNGDVASDIFDARDNGVIVWNIPDGGDLLGSQVTSGTTNRLRVPTGQANTVPGKPACAAATDVGAMLYLDDTNDTAGADACMCGKWADDTTFSWASMMHNDIVTGNPSACSL